MECGVKPLGCKAQSLTLSLLQPFIPSQWNPFSPLSPSFCLQIAAAGPLPSPTHKEQGKPRVTARMKGSMSLDPGSKVQHAVSLLTQTRKLNKWWMFF